MAITHHVFLLDGPRFARIVDRTSTQSNLEITQLISEIASECVKQPLVAEVISEVGGWVQPEIENSLKTNSDLMLFCILLGMCEPVPAGISNDLTRLFGLKTSRLRSCGDSVSTYLSSKTSASLQNLFGEWRVPATSSEAYIVEPWNCWDDARADESLHFEPLRQLRSHALVNERQILHLVSG